MVISPVLIWYNFMLTGKLVSSACSLALYDCFAAGAFGSVLDFSSSVGVGAAGAGVPNPF